MENVSCAQSISRISSSAANISIENDEIETLSERSGNQKTRRNQSWVWKYTRKHAKKNQKGYHFEFVDKENSCINIKKVF